MRAVKIQKGFAMPMVLAFLVIIGLLGSSIVQSTVQTNGSAVRHSQVQIAHIASKAAIDFAEEQYELNSGYSGTAEQDLFSNDYYRATIEVTVLYDEGSNAKRVQGTGRVYIPETSSTAKVVRDIKSTIIRNGEVIYTLGQVDPATFSPLLWLDANEPNALYKSAVTNTQTITALYGSSNGDIVEEGGADATTVSNRGLLSFGGDDLEMSWDGSSLGHQTIGLRFRGLNVPKNAVIDNAYIQFTTDETKSAGVVQLLAEGVATDDSSSWSGTYAVTNSPKTAASYTWSPSNWNSVGASGVNERLTVTNIVQELVNRTGWSVGNDASFSISWMTGSGVRTAEKGQNGSHPRLFIQWSSPAGIATANGDSIEQWYDKSGNNNNALFTFGARPKLQLSQINGLDAVRFSSDGALLATLSASVTSQHLTVFAVMLPRTSSSTDARFVSLMNDSQNDDNNTANGIIPLMKSGSSSTLTQRYNNSGGETLSSAIDGAWGVFTSQLSGSSSSNEWLLKNSTPENKSNVLSPNYTVNQIYVGGRRSVSSGVNYANMDLAELIVYNRQFTCTEMQQIENYLEVKYDRSYGEKTCT
jgi:type II secretory pathway pseudopilin PulG